MILIGLLCVTNCDLEDGQGKIDDVVVPCLVLAITDFDLTNCLDMH